VAIRAKNICKYSIRPMIDLNKATQKNFPQRNIGELKISKFIMQVFKQMETWFAINAQFGKFYKEVVFSETFQVLHAKKSLHLKLV